MVKLDLVDTSSLEVEGVYLFFLERLGKYYIGETVNLAQRLQQHLEGSNVPEISQEYKEAPETVFYQYTFLPNSTKDERLDLEQAFKESYKAKVGWDNLLNKCDYREDFTVRKAVFQFTTEGEFLEEYRSLMDVERATGFSFRNIAKACNQTNRVVSAFGYLWIYKDDYTPHKIVERVLRYKNRRGVEIPVHAFDSEGNWVMGFRSMTEAQKLAGFNQAYISLCISGKCKTHRGFTWLSEEQLKEKPKVNLDKPGNVLKVDRKTGKVLDRYESVLEAGTDNDIQPGNISKVLNDKRDTAGGFNWQWITDVDSEV